MEQIDNGQGNFEDLSAAAVAIFGGASNVVPIKSLGRSITIRPATMKNLNLLIEFFKELINGMDQEALGGLVEMIADRQIAATKAGEDPSNLDLEEIAGVSVVTKAFKNVSLIAMLLSATLGILPRVAPIFSDITEDEFGDLPPDEGMLIAGGIFMLNYGFFTQSLPPLLTAFTKSWASKNIPALQGKGKTK